MSERRAVLIANPHAGRRGGARRAHAIEDFCNHLKSLGVEVTVQPTSGPNDAARLAAAAAGNGTKEVIVSGGDGTLNEALQGLVGTNARLGIWASGTANVLARELRLPFDAREAANVIARGQTKRIYVGCATEEATGERRYFFLMAGIGLDASVVQGVRAGLKRRLGKGAFWLSGLSHLVKWEPVPFEVEVDGQSFPATFAAIGKSSRYGGDLAITPRARLDEPEFEICLVNSRNRLRYLHLLAYAMRGGARLDRPGVRYLKASRARATGHSLIQVDGELIGSLPMTFEIAPSPINVITK
jgi:YegS/Rv2252/BmrU family lipid kinase